MTRWLRTAALALLATLATEVLVAQEDGFAFLRVGVTARPVALGEAYVAQYGDLNTFMYNPANVALLDGHQVTASYVDFLLDVGAGNIGYGQPIGDLGVFGASLIFFNYGDFQGFDETGNQTRDFGSSSFTINGFYANSFNPQLQYGVNLKYVQFNIDDYSSSALAMDLGVIYAFPQQNLQFGVSLLNIGHVTSAFIEAKDGLPLALQLGVSKRLTNAPIEFSFGFSELNQEGSFGNRLSRFNIGMEVRPIETLFLRLGYNNQTHQELSLDDSDFLSRVAGLSAGFGFTFKKITLDYAFTSWGIGTLNRFSLYTSF